MTYFEKLAEVLGKKDAARSARDQCPDEFFEGARRLCRKANLEAPCGECWWREMHMGDDDGEKGGEQDV